MRGRPALSRLSLSGGTLILGSKNDLAGQFSRLVKRGWSSSRPLTRVLRLWLSCKRVPICSSERRPLAPPPGHVSSATPDQVRRDTVTVSPFAVTLNSYSAEAASASIRCVRFPAMPLTRCLDLGACARMRYRRGHMCAEAERATVQRGPGGL